MLKSLHFEDLISKKMGSFFNLVNPKYTSDVIINDYFYFSEFYRRHPRIDVHAFNFRGWLNIFHIISQPTQHRQMI